MSIKIKGVVSTSLATLTMLSTVLSLAGFAAMPIAASAVAPADYGLKEGDTISAVGSQDPDIYIVNDWGYKRLFVNPAIFTLYGHLSWAGVKSVSAATRDAFGTSGLFRNCETGDQKVYGLEVISEDVANLRWVNTTGAQAVADDPNFFKKVFCINSAEKALYGTGADYTSVNQIPAYTRGVTPVVTGNVTVSLASDNPAASTLIETQAAADLAHFTFTGSGTVTNLVLNRIGVSSDTTLSNVYLYEGTKRLTDAATVSSGKITFSDTAGLFTVSGSKTISIKGTVADTTTGQTIGVQLITVNTDTVSLSGNLHTIATDPTDFGTIAVGVPTPTAANATLDPQKDYALWQSTVTIANHDALLKSIQFRIVGSVATGDIQNLRLYVDGAQVGSTISQVNMGSPDNGYVVFNFGSGTTLKTGSRIMKVVVDIIGGSTKTVSLSLRQKPDFYAIESQYGASILPSGTFPAAAPTTSTHTIASGSLTITKASDSAAGDVIDDSSAVSLVKYKFEAFGESLKIENLRASFTSSKAATTSLRNGAVYADGVQIGSVAHLCEDSVTTTASCSSGVGYREYSLGSSLVVVPGTPRYVEIKADIYDNTGTENTAAGDTIAAQFAIGSSNVQRLVSLDYFNSAAATAGNTLTIKTGSFAAAKDTAYSSQTMVSPQSAYKLGAFTLTAASSEDISVSTLATSNMTGTGNFDGADDLTNLFLKVYDNNGALVTQTTPKSTVSSTASNSFQVSFTIPKTKTYKVEVYANVGSGADSGTMNAYLEADGLTVNSATAVYATAVAGQTITASTASLNLSNGASPASSMVVGGTRKAVYVFTLQPQYDSFTLEEANFRIASTSGTLLASQSGAVAMAYLMDGTNQIGSSPLSQISSGAFEMTGLSLPITSAGGTKTLTLQLDFANVGVNANDTGGVVKMQLTHLKYRDSNGTVTSSTLSPASYQGNSMYLYKAYPSFANLALPSTVLAGGTQTLFKTTLSAVGNAIVWRKLAFTVNVSDTPTVTSWKLYEDGVDITDLATVTSGSAATGIGATGEYEFSNAAGSVAASQTGHIKMVFATERSVPANSSVTLELKATIGGTNTAGDYVSTKIANPHGSTPDAQDDFDAVVTANDATFGWSDSSAATHSGTTDDWMGDGLVKSINATQTLYQ